MTTSGGGDDGGGSSCAGTGGWCSFVPVNFFAFRLLKKTSVGAHTEHGRRVAKQGGVYLQLVRSCSCKSSLFCVRKRGCGLHDPSLDTERFASEMVPSVWYASTRLAPSGSSPRTGCCDPTLMSGTAVCIRTRGRCSWYDPTLISKAAFSLKERGCGVCHDTSSSK